MFVYDTRVFYDKICWIICKWKESVSSESLPGLLLFIILYYIHSKYKRSWNIKFPTLISLILARMFDIIPRWWLCGHERVSNPVGGPEAGPYRRVCHRCRGYHRRTCWHHPCKQWTPWTLKHTLTVMWFWT